MKKILICVVILCTIFFNINWFDQANASDWNQINTPFGSSIYNLLVGTTINNGFMLAGTFSPNGGELWRTSDGTNWASISEAGFGDENNIGVVPGLSFQFDLFMASINSNNLYASTFNTNGTQIWKSTNNGNDWNKLVDGGFGNSDNIGISANAYFDEYLYVATFNDSGFEIWRSNNETNWEKVGENGFGDENNWSITSLMIYNNDIYAFTSNWETGGEIWRSSNGTNWEQVGTDGLGDTDNILLESHTTFEGQLYLGTWNPNGGQLWSTSNGTDWTQIIGPGFLKPQNMGLSPQLDYNGYMYLGVYNILGILGISQVDQKLFDNTQIADHFKSQTVTNGCEIWATNNGSSWQQINETGFGNEHNISVVSSSILGNYLYSWTFKVDIDQGTFGNELWRTHYLGYVAASSTTTDSNSTNSSNLTILPRTGIHK